METPLPTLLVGGPIRDRETCAPTYLEYLYQQTYPRERTRLAFCINNSTDCTGAILHQFAHNYQTEYAGIDLLEVTLDNSPGFNRATEGRTDQHFVALAQARNLFLGMLRDEAGIVSVDSDIYMLDPDTLTKLVQHDKDIVAALVQNGPKVHCDHNVLMWSKEDRSYAQHYRQPFPDGLMECDVTGACYYIHRKVVEAGVRYGFHPQGEDLYFCRQAQEQGFTLYVDPTIKTQHLLA